MTKIDESKVVFVHDHCFLVDAAGQVYSEGKITDAVIQRMHPLAETIVVVSRLRAVEDTSGLVPLMDPRIQMSPVKGVAFYQIFGRYLFYNILTIWRVFGSARIVVLRLPCLLSVLAAPIIWARATLYSVEVVGFPRDGLMGKGDSFAVRTLGTFLHHLTKRLIKNARGALYVTQQVLQDAFPTQGLSAAASNVELSDAEFDLANAAPKPLGSPVRIGLIGSMAANYKGIDVGIKATSILLEKGYDVKFHILGSGETRPYEVLARDLDCVDAVCFDGTRAGGAPVLRWLDELDIYIQPSRTEGLPRALVEAMSRGLPAIATNVGGIPELLDQRWLVEPAEPVALAEKMELLIKSDKLRATAKSENRSRASGYRKSILQAKRSAYYNSISQILLEEE